jgi:sugar phosphate isomerase/epimerase
MNKDWSSYCTMSIVHFMAFPETGGGQGPVVESVSKIAEDDFFDAIEIAWIADATVRREVRQILEISQLQVGFCAHPAILSQKLNLNSLDESQRLEAIDQMKELIDQADELGARRFVFLSGPDAGDADREAAIEALIDSIRQMCAYGKEKGIGLTLETFDRRVDKKALIGPVRDAAQVAEAVRADYPDFGLLYDLSHMPILDESPRDMDVIKGYLVHAHVGNCVKAEGRALYGDQHPYFGFPGGVNGVDELAEFIRGLFEIGYLAEDKDPKPWVGFEVKPHGPGQTPELIIANAKRNWRQAWIRV